MNLNRAHTIRNGISLGDSIYIFELDTDPTSGFDAPPGSICIGYGSMAGKSWIKNGASNNDWSNIDNSDLSEEVQKLKKDQISLALEMQSLKDREGNPTLSFFVDSFDDDEFISSDSVNYLLNQVDGYVYNDTSNPKNLIDTTKDQFDQGSLTNIDSILEPGGDGLIRKHKTVDGAIVVLEDFEDTSNVGTQKEIIVFQEDFESGDLSSWYMELLSNDDNTGIVSNNIVGNYGLRIDGDDRAYSPSFSCQGLTGVKVRMYLAGPSFNNADEELVVGWYDGTIWHEIHAVEDNEQGYVTVSIPDAWLASNNQLVFDNTNNSTLFGGTNGGGDIGYIDDITVFYNTVEPLPQELSSFIIYVGSSSGKFYIDFKNNETNKIDIMLSNVDISLAKYLRLFILKPGDGDYQYKISVHDSTSGVWNSSNLNFSNTKSWFAWEQLISGITGINLTNVTQVSVEFIESTEIAAVWNDSYTPTSTTIETIVSNYDNIKQTFLVNETCKVGRIELGVRTRDNQPRMPLYVGLADVFGTVKAVAMLNGNQTNPTSYSDIWNIVADFDSEVTLYANHQYMLRFYTEENSWSYAWDVRMTPNNYYSDGLFYIYTTPESDDVSFRLLSPSVKENIYLDNLEVESESTYVSTGEFISRPIDLGVIPTSLSGLICDLDENADEIQVQLRFGSSLSSLLSATWGSIYTNPIGDDDVSGESPLQWFQYRVVFTNGNTTESSTLKKLTLQYNTLLQSQSTVISTASITNEQPDMFILRYQEDIGSGDIVYFVSRNNGLNWQFVDRDDEGNFIEFNSNAGFGTQLKIKAVISGDAKLYGWSLACDKEFL